MNETADDSRDRLQHPRNDVRASARRADPRTAQALRERYGPDMRRFVTLPEAAALLGVSWNTARDMLREGSLLGRRTTANRQGHLLVLLESVLKAGPC